MAKPKVSKAEATFAYQFLRYLGGDASNYALLLGVVAWMRKESGQRYLGNNPLNIRNSRFASGYRQTKENGRFAVFRNLTVAAKATAAFLREHRGYGYEEVIAAAKPRGLKSDDHVGQQKQTVSFLLALALSKWSSDHYGLGLGAITRGDDPSKYIYSTVLYKVWAKLYGSDIDIPPEASKPWEPPQPKPVRKPKTPSAEDYPLPAPHSKYIDPFETRSFYEARVKPLPPLPL